MKSKHCWRRPGMFALLFAALLGAMVGAYLCNHAPISRIDAAFRECDRATIRFVDGQGIERPEMPCIHLVDKDTIGKLRRSLSLWKAFRYIDLEMPWLPVSACGDGWIEVVLACRESDLSHFRILGNEIEVLDDDGTVRHKVCLSSVDAYFLLLNLRDDHVQTEVSTTVQRVN